MALSKIIAARRIVQWIMALIMMAIGLQYTLWVTAHLNGRWPAVSRPAGAEGFLPIDALIGFRHLVTTGEITPVHPAGLAIFIGILLMSLVVAKSFCSHICPVGLISELLGRFGIRFVGKTLTPPKWLDIPLRSLKFLIFGFFAWAILYSMTPHDVEVFLSSPYAKIVDAKMWLFFAPPSRLTIAFFGALAVGSIFVRDLWCRYLCPYGALVGLIGRFAILKVTRDKDLCTDCGACTRVCPARLPVHTMHRVSSIECTSCQDCVAACPAKSCLKVRAPLPRPIGRSFKPATVVAIALALYFVVVMGFRVTGHWHSNVTEQEYHERLQGDLTSPEYNHIGR